MTGCLGFVLGVFAFFGVLSYQRQDAVAAQAEAIRALEHAEFLEAEALRALEAETTQAFSFAVEWVDSDSELDTLDRAFALVEPLENRLLAWRPDVAFQPEITRREGDTYGIDVRVPRGAQFDPETLSDVVSTTGGLSVRRRVLESDLVAGTTSVMRERERLDAWRTANPEGTLEAFNALPRDAGGPAAGLRWCSRAGSDQPTAIFENDPVAQRITLEHVRALHASEDLPGVHSVAIQLDEEGAAALRTLTEGLVGRSLFVIAGNRVLSAPRVMEPLSDAVVINGRFTEDQARALVAVLGHPFPGGRLVPAE